MEHTKMCRKKQRGIFDCFDLDGARLWGVGCALLEDGVVGEDGEAGRKVLSDEGRRLLGP